MNKGIKVITVDYVTPHSMMALAASFLGIIAVLLSLRLVSRRLQNLRLGIDDILIVAAWLATMAMCINVITAVSFRVWGASIPLVTDDTGTPVAVDPRFPLSMKFYFIQEVIFPVQLTFTKLSVLFCYLRLLCPEKKSFLYQATLVTVVVTTLWGISMFFGFLFQCKTDFQFFWDVESPNDGQCLGPELEVFMTISDAVLDIIVFVLPIYRLLTLHLPIRKRLMLFAVFAVGSMSVIASLIRMAWYMPILYGLEDKTLSVDPNIMISTIMYWGMFEAGFAVTAACLPSLKYLVERATNKLFNHHQQLSIYVTSLQSSGASTPTPSRSPRISLGWSRDIENAAPDEEKGPVPEVAVTSAP